MVRINTGSKFKKDYHQTQILSIKLRCGKEPKTDSPPGSPRPQPINQPTRDLDDLRKGLPAQYRGITPS